MTTVCQGRNIQVAQVSILPCDNFFTANIYTLVLLSCISPFAVADEYFNPHLLEVEGSQSTSVDLSYLTQEVPPPGEYNLDVYINNQFIASKPLVFKPMDANDKSSVQLCLSIQDLKDWFVNTENMTLFSGTDAQCVKLSAYPEVKVAVSLAQQRVDLTFPQAMMLNLPKGYVPESRWEQGINAGLLNYSISGQSSRAKNGGSTSESQFVSLQPGVNMLGWYFRNYSTFNHDEDGGKWESIYNYISRDIGILKSQLVLGNSNTSSKVFDSLSFTGVQLHSDEEMLPDSMHGYAPIIRGIARTNAEVTVYQNKYSIYKTTVPPGAFEITDLYPTGSAGDLYVEVKESDGSKQNFVVPYASLAVLQREGQLQYAFSGGRTRSDNSGTREFNFVQSSLTYGLTSNMSLYGGFQFADSSYSNLLLGAGFNMGGIGAVSFDVSQSSADVKQDTGSERLTNSQGQSYRMRFSKSFPQAGTSFSVAGYRYSTHGYYSFQDYIDNVSNVDSSDYTKMSRERTRNRFDISASQILADYGSLSLSLISESYWNDSRMESLSLGYSNTIGKASYFINYSYNRNVTDDDNIGSGTTSDSVISLTISIPFGPDLSANYSMNDGRSSRATHSVGVNGTLLDDRSLNWSAQEGYDSGEKSTSGNLNLNYQGSRAEISGGYGYDNYSNRYNYSLRGGMMLHSGGLTLSRPLGESVALVETPGASDLAVRGQTNIKTDAHGYAVIPYVRAYHENSFALDDDSLSAAEVENISKTVVPVRNAVVKIKYVTHIGYKSIVVLKFNGNVVPFGAIATLNSSDSDGQENNGSIVGDAGSVYLSGMPDKGKYTVKWGAGAKEQCSFNYDFSSKELSEDIIFYQANCQ